MKRAVWMPATLVLLLGVTACGGENGSPLGAEGQAQMQVAVTGDAPESGSSTGSSDASGSTSSQAQGTVDVRAQVFVQSSTGGWTELTRGAAQQTVVLASDAQGRTMATAKLAAGSYQRVRIVFEDVRANVTGGLQLGTGLLTGEVRVAGAGDSRITVEREIDVRLRSDAQAQLLIDLNAQAWLDRVDASTRTVGEADFRNAVDVVVR